MSSPLPAAHAHLAIEAELAAGPCRFVRERLRLPMGLEASFGWLRHPPSVLVVPRLVDGRLLLERRYRPAVGRWVLEFPSGPLQPQEEPSEAAARLVGQLTGQLARGWQELGVVRPNPGYSDERMTVGWMGAEGPEGDPPGAGPGADRQLLQLRPPALDAALRALEEPVDGRTVTAWFLARARWSEEWP